MTDIKTLVDALLDLDDPVAPKAFADHLEEAGHRYARDVRDLSEVKMLMPLGLPRPEDSYPLAIGRWWTIDLFGECVRPTVHRISPYHEIFSHSVGAGIYGVEVTQQLQSEPIVQRCFEVCRRQLMAELAGYFCVCLNLFRKMESMESNSVATAEAYLEQELVA